MNKGNLIVGVLTLVVTIGIALFNYYDAEKYKDKLKVEKAVSIHTDLKYKVEKYLNFTQEIMQDKISIIYMHNNIINGINLSKNMQYEMQYKISSFPKYASVNISAFKKSIEKKNTEIKDKLSKLKKLKLDIKETFKKLELYENNSKINIIKEAYTPLFTELIDSMELAYNNSLKIQKNVSTIHDTLIIDNDNKEIPNSFFIPLENDEKFYKLLKNSSAKIRENLDLIDPRIL